MNKNVFMTLTLVLIVFGTVGTIIGANNVPLLMGLACINWISYQAESIKEKL